MLKKEIQQFKNSKGINEIIDNTPNSWLYFFSFVSVFAFILNPFIKMTMSLFFPPSNLYFNFDSGYSTFISSINKFATIIGAIAIIIYLAKKANINAKIKTIAKENIPMTFFLVFMIFILISTIVNGFIEFAFTYDSYRNESIFTYFCYIIIYFFCATFIKSKKLKSILMYSYMVVSIYIGIFVIIDNYFYKLEAFSLDVGISAIFHQFNHYGYFLLFAILLSGGLLILEKNMILKILCAITFIFNNVILILNNTFGCWLAVAVSLIFEVIVISVMNKKFIKASLLPMIIFLLVALIMGIWYETIFSQVIKFFKDIILVAEDIEENDSTANSAGTGRWNLWKHTAKYITEKPIFGWGVEGISGRLYSETNGCNNRPHNEYLQYAAFFGIPAAIMYISGVFSVFLNAWKKRFSLDIYTATALIASFGYAFSALFGNTMYYTAPFFFIFLGLSFSVCEDKTN